MTHSLQVLHSLLWHQPSKGEQTPLCSSPTTPTLIRYLGLFMKSSRALVTPPEKARNHNAPKLLWPSRDVTTRFPARAWREKVLCLRAQRVILLF